MSEDLKAMFRRMRKKDLMYSGNLGGSAQGGSGGGSLPDITAPSLSTAVIPSAGTTIVLTYNENLLATGDGVPDTTDYTISASGGAVTVSTRSVSTTTVTLTLSRTISQGETVTLTYTAGASGRVQDASLNISSNFTNQAVTNDSTVDTTAPTISTAVVPAAGTTLGLTYNENLLASGDGIPDIADYSVTSGGTLVTISAVSVSGAIVTLNLARTITSGETLSFNYTAGASGRVQDAANNIASNLTSQAVTNNASDIVAPSLSSPTDTKTGSSTANLQVVSDETNGTTYYVVTRSATPPTKAQVKSGLDDGGSAAVKTGSISASTTLSWSVTSLSASTTFYAHFMQEDVATNQSDVASGDGFITDAAGGSDPDFASVVYLVGNDNAADASTTFDDQSSSNHSLTANSDPAYSSSTAPTGMTTSIALDGNDSLDTSAASANFAYGTGDYTIEGWYIKSDDLADYTIFDHVGGSGAFSLRVDTTNALRYSAIAAFKSGGAASAGTNGNWHHFAITRATNVTKMFVDGTQVGTNTTDNDNFATDATFRIGRNRAGSAFWVGNLCSIRVTKGVARYTAGFTPPTLPLPTS
jgi:uncharacterized repeat protein (TIGR02059 family)